MQSGSFNSWLYLNSILLSLRFVSSIRAYSMPPRKRVIPLKVRLFLGDMIEEEGDRTGHRTETEWREIHSQCLQIGGSQYTWEQVAKCYSNIKFRKKTKKRAQNEANPVQKTKKQR